jgi:copper chaperone
MAETRFKVEDMSCEHCKMTVSKALAGVAGVSKVDVDLGSKDVSVVHEQKVGLEQLRQAVEAAGYTLS